MSKSVVRGKPSAAAKKEQKKGNYVTSSKEHPTFGIMKITSQLDQQKIRFACISSAERKCVCQVTSSQVPDLETGTKIMTLVMDKMIDNPDKTDKKDIYKLRDEIREEVLKTMNWTPAKDTVTAKKKGKGTDIEESEKGKERDEKQMTDDGDEDDGKRRKREKKDKDKDVDKSEKDKGENKKQNKDDSDKGIDKHKKRKKDAKGKVNDESEEDKDEGEKQNKDDNDKGIGKRKKRDEKTQRQARTQI